MTSVSEHFSPEATCVYDAQFALSVGGEGRGGEQDSRGGHGEEDRTSLATHAPADEKCPASSEATPIKTTLPSPMIDPRRTPSAFLRDNKGPPKATTREIGGRV